MNKRSEIFPRAMSKWLTNTFFDIDSLLIRILKFNFFFMQFYNKWKWLILLMKTSNVNKNIMSVTSFFFFYSPNPCNMSHKKRKYQDQPSHSALVTNALLNGRASVLNIKQEPNGNSSLFFLRTKTNFLSSHLVFPGSNFAQSKS